MKNKSRYTFLLTALVAASACVMQVQAQESSDSNLDNKTCYLNFGYDNCVLNQVGVPFADVVEMTPIELHLPSGVDLLGNKNTGILHIFGIGSGSYYGSPDFWLSNADQIDSGVLELLTKSSSNAIRQPRFKAVAPGTVTLTFEGDIVVEKGTWSYLHWSYSPDKTEHVTVHVPVNVVE